MAKKEILINPKLLVLAKGIIYLMAVAVLVVLGILMPELAREEKAANPNAGPVYPFFIGAWIIAAPIFIALAEALKLVSYVKQNKVFTKLSINALQKIKICTMVFIMLIILGAAIILIQAKIMDPSDDYAPVGVFAIVFTFVGSVIATFTDVLQKLVREVRNIKKENDLTV